MKHKAAQKASLKVLFLEDSPRDVEIIRELLTDAGFDFNMDYTDKKKEYVSLLGERTYDVILSDFTLPGFDGFEALDFAKKICPDVPFICVSGSIGEETAIELIKRGAVDYILKDRVAKLPLAIKRALDEVKEKNSLRQAEEALRESEERYRLLFDSSMDGILLASPTGEIFSANSAMCNMVHRSEQEIRSLGRNGIVDVSDPRLAPALENSLKTGSFSSELTLLRKDGSKFPGEVSTVLFKDKKGTDHTSMIIRDITERKRAEEKLIKNEALLSTAVEKLPLIFYIIDPDGTFKLSIGAGLKGLGLKPNQVVGQSAFDVYKDFPAITDSIKKSFAGEVVEFESHVAESSFANFLVPFSYVKGVFAGIVGVALDITERKKAEQEIMKLTRMYALLSNINKAIVRIHEQQQLFSEVCRIPVETGNFRMAWLGMVNPETHKVDIAASAGTTDDYLSKISIDLKDKKRSQGPTGRAIKSGTHAISNDIEHDDTLLPWREDAARLGYRSSAAFPIKVSGKVLGAYTIYSSESGFFNADEIKVLDEMAMDISFAIEFIQRESERKQAEEKANHLAAIVQSSEDAIVGKNLDGIITSWNKGAEKLYGYTESEVIGKSISLLIPSGNKDEVSAILERLKSGEHIEHYETTRRTKDGREIQMSLTLSPIRDREGTIIAASTIGRDITEWKRAEEAIRESEERFRMVFENVFDGVSIYNEDPDPSKRTLVECNERYAAMAGRSREELLTLGTTQALQKPREDSTNDSRLRALHSMTVYQGSFSWLRPDGKENIVEYIGMPVTWRGKQYSISIDRDITERKRAEEALTYERNLLNALLDSIPDQVYFKDRDSRFLRISRALAHRFGFDDPAQTIGKTDLDFFAAEHARKAFEDEQKIMKSGIALVSLEEKESWADGRQTWVSTTKVPLRNVQGEIIGTFGISRDITERKEAEEERHRLMTAFEQAAEAIIVTDPRGIIQYVNPAFEEITGFARVEAIGQNPRIMNSGRQNAGFYEGLWKTISTGGKWNGRFINKKKDGTLFTDETSISPVFNEKGEIINYVAVKRDITSELSLQTQLAQAQKLEGIGTLASGIAHDFNNILGIIMGHTSLLDRLREDSQKYAESVATIMKATQRGTSLVKQLMLFARKTEPLLESVKINDMVGEITKLFQQTFPKTITISVSLQRELPAIVADSSQIHQVLLNLLVNARDAMPNGGMISITTMAIGGETVSSRFPKATASQYIKVEIADTGTGMDEATRQRIFEPFFTTKGPGKGTGLGLAVVFGIVEHHNGFIEVASALGEGTSFTVYLPIPESAAEEMQAAGKSLANVPGGTETVLLIEDEEVLRKLAKDILVSRGYTVLAAGNGMEGVEMYRSHQKEIAVVLSDIGLPILGGHDVFKNIRAINPEAKVIFASGFFDPETKAEMYSAGLKDFIQKPYMQDEVLQKIREAIDTK